MCKNKIRIEDLDKGLFGYVLAYDYIQDFTSYGNNIFEHIRNSEGDYADVTKVGLLNISELLIRYKQTRRRGKLIIDAVSLTNNNDEEGPDEKIDQRIKFYTAKYLIHADEVRTRLLKRYSFYLNSTKKLTPYLRR